MCKPNLLAQSNDNNARRLNIAEEKLRPEH